MMGDLFAEFQVDPPGVVDEEPQRLVARLLDGEQVDFRVELGKLALNVLLKVSHVADQWGVRKAFAITWGPIRAVKKVGQAHFSNCAIQIGTEKLGPSIARPAPWPTACLRARSGLEGGFYGGA